MGGSMGGSIPPMGTPTVASAGEGTLAKSVWYGKPYLQ